jgi:hypothetical protein
LWNNSLSLEDQGSFENEIEFSNGFADIQLPPILNSLTGLDQPNIPTAIKANDTRNIKVEKSRVEKDPT